MNKDYLDARNIEDIIAERDFLEEQHKLCKNSEKFKLHFVFEALRIVLSEAEESSFPNVDLDWIWESLYTQLFKKANKSQENYILGMFIFALTKNGSPALPAIQAVADWTHKAETTCRSSFYEIKKLSNIEEVGFWFTTKTLCKTDFCILFENQTRIFSSKNKKTQQAFEKLKQLSQSKDSQNLLSTGINTTKSQFLSNEKIREHIKNRSK
jgi:hypothetical protein